MCLTEKGPVPCMWSPWHVDAGTYRGEVGPALRRQRPSERDHSSLASAQVAGWLLCRAGLERLWLAPKNHWRIFSLGTVCSKNGSLTRPWWECRHPWDLRVVSSVSPGRDGGRAGWMVGGGTAEPLPQCQGQGCHPGTVTSWFPPGLPGLLVRPGHSLQQLCLEPPPRVQGVSKCTEGSQVCRSRPAWEAGPAARVEAGRLSCPRGHWEHSRKVPPHLP